jgi:hypothetical protein
MSTPTLERMMACPAARQAKLRLPAPGRDQAGRGELPGSTEELEAAGSSSPEAGRGELPPVRGCASEQGRI